MDNTTHLHPWEKVGLGKAPFRCVGSEVSEYQACPGAPIQPGSSCDYCPAGIKYVFWIQGVDGSRFKVGSSCVEKVNDKGSRVLTQVQRHVRDLKRKEAATRAKKRRAGLVEYLLTLEGRRSLRAIDHPQQWAADQGQTLLDNTVWRLRNSGQAGTLKTLRGVNKALGTKF